MSLDVYPLRGSHRDWREFLVKFVGGSAAVTKVFGLGVTVTYISTGIVDLVWSDSQGAHLGTTWGFEATTQSGCKGYTVVAGVYNATTRTQRLNITNASETLADLAALQWLTLRVSFGA